MRVKNVFFFFYDGVGFFVYSLPRFTVKKVVFLPFTLKKDFFIQNLPLIKP